MELSEVTGHPIFYEVGQQGFPSSLPTLKYKIVFTLKYRTQMFTIKYMTVMFTFYKFYKYVHLGLDKFLIRCKKHCMHENILI